MKVFCSVIGRKWDNEYPHITQMALWSYAKALRAEGFDCVQWEWNSKFPTEPGAFLIQPGFNLPGGKYMTATRLVMDMCHVDRRHLVLFTGDVENLHTWWPYVKDKGIKHGLVTSFKFPWKAWKAQWRYHERSAYYDLDSILPTPNIQPKFQAGYVGWPKPHRFKVIKKIGYRPLVLLGFGADKQDEFPYAFCDRNTPYNLLGELFRSCAWQVCISDNQINEVGPCVCRQFEAWKCDRPCAFHSSFIEGMERFVDFSKVEAWKFDSDVELHRISKIGQLSDGSYDLVELKRIADEQRLALMGQMMDPFPVTERTVKYLEGPYADPEEIQLMGDASTVLGRGREHD